MWPSLFKIGPITLHSYGALVALGFFLGYLYTLTQAKRHGLHPDTVTDLIWVLLLSGITGARIFYVLLNFSYYRAAPVEIIKIWDGGLVFYGGFLAATLAGIVWARRQHQSALLWADLLSPALPLGHAFGRLGCLAAGCCYGHPTTLPWRITFTHPQSLAPLNAPLHPSQVYESLLNFILFAALAAFQKCRPDSVGTGRLTIFYLAAYGLIRWGVELTRGDDRGPVLLSMTVTQWLAVASVAAAGALWWALSKRSSHA